MNKSILTKYKIQKCPISWARNADYAVTEISTSKSEPLPYLSELQWANLPAPIKDALQLEAVLECKPPSIIHTIDLEILIWNWNPHDQSERNHKFFLISRSNELLASEPSTAEYWLKYFPFIKWNNDSTFSISEGFFPETTIYKFGSLNSSLCLGGKHFGHWVADTLPNIVMSAQYLPANAIVTNELSQDEKFFIWNKLRLGDSKFIHPPLPRERLSRFIFTKTDLIQNVSVSRKNRHLRDRLFRMTTTPLATSNTSVYLERGTVNLAKRITNEQEVINEMNKANVRVIDPRDYPFFRYPEFYFQFRNFIFYNSSVNTNFNILGSKCSRALIILHPSYSSSSEELVLGSSIYLTPRAHEIQFAVLKSSDQSHHHTPVRIDPDFVRESLRPFLALSEFDCGQQI
jgi:hypothetical protein